MKISHYFLSFTLKSQILAAVLSIVYPSPSTHVGEGNGTPLQHSCLENPVDGGAWWAAVSGGCSPLRVGHDWATSLSLFTFMHWRRKCSPLQCSCLESPTDGGAWWAAVYGVAQSQTRLKRLSRSSSSSRGTFGYCGFFSNSSWNIETWFELRSQWNE